MGSFRSNSRDTALLVVSFLFLAGAGLDRLSMRPSRMATAYHARVREAYERLPKDFGNWRGIEVPEPADAIDILKPNVLLSRIYEDPSTNRRATFLLVQCTDVRDLISHYPPICYPNQGLHLLLKYRPSNWTVGGLEIRFTEYAFEASTLEDSRLTVVYNFMVLPDNRTMPDMEEASRHQSLDRRFYGMAQVQIVFDGRVPPEEREKIAVELIGHHMKLIDVIRLGASV